jgi:uncharacterized RDD family membrane protein YckC
MSSNPPGPDLSLGSFSDKLTIETPEQTALDFQVAGIGSRFLAVAIDMLIQALAGIVVTLAGFMLMGLLAFAVPGAAVWGFAILLLFFFLLYFGYYAFFEILWNGQTPGKRKVGIRVIKDSGRPLTPAESIARNLMRIVDWLPGVYAIGMASIILTRENKRLGDLVAGSLVVREASFSDLKPIWQTAPVPTGPTLPPLGADRLSPEECTLIDSYLARRNALNPDVRNRMAEEIYRRVQPKLTLPTDEVLYADKVLEALAYERRATGRYS